MVNKEYYIKIKGEKIPVTEEVYRTYKRSIWTEEKRKEREKLCRVSNGKGGQKRCTENCSKCKRSKTGGVLSIDRFEEDGHIVEDPTEDIAEAVAYKVLLEKLYKVLHELDPHKKRICELLMDGHSKREIARVMSIPQSSFEYQFKKLMASLKDRLENYI